MCLGDYLSSRRQARNASATSPRARLSSINIARSNPARLETLPRAKRLVVAGLLAAAIVTAAFDYFGRPTLVIDGMFKTGQLPPGDDATSYELGPPRWGIGTVTYPFTTGRIDTADGCTGTITLRWSVFDWQQAAYQCLPGLKK